ncbi:hypothetical protein MRB53_023816 [Persea americana]|uniref:Uncharacterized protein n=1 Tax=Persea americana TaxID=3435 RepID=A0ACC2LBN4_PERAE|nr:hypothetical protein MRB53_023816 [Persea americana]
MSPSYTDRTTFTTTNSGESSGATTISALPPDVLTHILSLLDGPALASASCASSHLHSLSAHPPLWRCLCTSSWPSTNHSPLSHLLSDHHAFFSDAFSALPLTTPPPPPFLPHPPHLISAVDLCFNDRPIISTILHTETRSAWFLTSPFRIDALDPEDPPPMTPAATLSGSTVAAEMSLTWIVVDPITRRAANLSSIRPVSVQRHWFSGKTQIRFATILGRGSHLVQCGIVVTCEGCEGERGGGGVQVREVCLQVEDMDGMNLNGEESLGILQMGMEGKRRRRREEEGRERGFYVGTSSWEEGLGIDQCCTFRGSMARLDILAGNIIWQIIMLQATIFKEELTQDLLFGQQSRD